MTRYFDIAPAPSWADTRTGASRRRRRSDAGVLDMRRRDSFPRRGELHRPDASAPAARSRVTLVTAIFTLHFDDSLGIRHGRRTVVVEPQPDVVATDGRTVRPPSPAVMMPGMGRAR